jgi:phytanoyl-CoA hydroxylase
MENKIAIKRKFETDGYVLIPSFLSEEEVQEITQHFNRVIKEVVPMMPKNQVFYEGEATPGTLKQLIDLQEHDSFFEEVLTKSKFSEIAAYLLDDEVIGKTLEYFNKPAQIGKPTPPHQDGYYFMLNPSVAVTMWMALEPADEENGCVKYVKVHILLG